MSLGEWAAVFSILIVDDDKILVDKLEETIQWEKIGVGTVFTAYNIRKAQNLLRSYPIDLLLSDVDMPQGNGLELLEWIKNENMDTKCVFLSSYANFAYVQKALKLGSVDYLLKPISNRDLETALQKVLSEIDMTKRNAREREEQNKDVLWRELLIAPSNALGRRMIEKEIEDGRYSRKQKFRLAALTLSNSPKPEKYNKTIRLLDFSIRNILEEFFDIRILEAIIHPRDTEWILVFNEADADMPDEQWRKEQLLSKIHELEENTLHSLFDQQIFIFIGRSGNFENIDTMYNRLEDMAMHIVPGDDRIVDEEMIPPEERSAPSIPWDQWRRFLLDEGSFDKVEKEAIAAIRKVDETIGWRREYLNLFVDEWNRLILQFITKQAIDIGQLFDTGELERDMQKAKESVSACENEIHTTIKTLKGFSSNERRQEDAVEQVITYIESHLSEDLSRKILAGQVYLSEDYLSKLFVKEKGMPLNNYVAMRRINRAKILLRGSDLPVSKVALKVGYTNFSYFSKTFKDFTGSTPNEYRMNRSL